MTFRLIFVSVICFTLLISAGQLPDETDKPRKKSRKNKKDEDPVTQVLPLPKDLPGAITADTDRLVFFASPLSTKGLMSAQTREALRYLMGFSKTATIVKLRAFVAGSGDTRRIQTLVSEVFTEKKLPLPVLTTIQVGSLGVEGAQVVVEATAMDRRVVNPSGVAFISGQTGKTYREAIDNVRRAMEAANAGEAIAVTCFVSSLEETQADRLASSLAAAGSTITVQMRREPSPTAAECEAAARLRTAPAQSVMFLNPEPLAKSASYSQVALVNAPKIVFTGLQLSFAGSDPKLAFDRLGRTIESQSASFAGVFFMHTYALTLQSMEQVRSTRFQYLDAGHPPASTLLPFEGLPSLDATFGIEAVAVQK